MKSIIVSRLILVFCFINWLFRQYNERNHIEGKFGQAKQGYGLNNIKAKLSDTSHSWIATIFFITNLVRFAELNNFQF